MDFEILFDMAPTAETLRQGVMLQRTQTVWAGDVLYVRCYPVWETRAMFREARAHRKARATSEAQRKLNQRNAQLKLEQLVNTNFGEGDIFATLTYSDDQQPADGRQAQRDMQNFIKRVKALCKRRGLDELKYIYTTEVTHSEKRGTRYHHHVIMSGEGLGREEIEALWKKGLINTRRCQQQEGQLSGLAVYMCKVKETQDKNGGRRWSSSKNLKKPRITRANHKISLRKVEQMARDIDCFGRAVMEQAFKGYRLIGDVSVRGSKFVPGAYIYAKMERVRTCRRRA